MKLKMKQPTKVTPHVAHSLEIKKLKKINNNPHYVIIHLFILLL
jgi:hypothetical protein